MRCSVCRLVPARRQDADGSRSWSLKVEGANEEARFVDHFENDTRLVSIAGDATTIGIDAWGEVETFDTSGIFGEHKGFAPLWLFQHQTALTAPGEAIRELAASIGPGPEARQAASADGHDRGQGRSTRSALRTAARPPKRR